jgi:hypothetical protein
MSVAVTDVVATSGPVQTDPGMREADRWFLNPPQKRARKATKKRKGNLNDLTLDHHGGNVFAFRRVGVLACTRPPLLLTGAVEWWASTPTLHKTLSRAFLWHPNPDDQVPTSVVSVLVSFAVSWSKMAVLTTAVLITLAGAELLTATVNVTAGKVVPGATLSA